MPIFGRKSPPSSPRSKSIFEPWQLAEFLENARQTEPFDAADYEDEDPEDIEMERQADIRQSAADLMLVEQAREWLLGKADA